MGSATRYFIYKAPYKEGDEPVEAPWTYRPIDIQMQQLAIKYGSVQVVEREIQQTSNEQQNAPSPGAETLDTFKQGK